MSVFVALLLAQSADLPPSGPDDEIENEIVVMAERLERISVNVGQDPEGRWHCSLSGSSGSARIDDLLCRTTTDCVRKAKGERETVERCVLRHRSDILDDFRRSIRRSRG